MIPESVAWAFVSSTITWVCTLYATGYLRLNWTTNAILIVVANFFFLALYIFDSENASWLGWFTMMCTALVVGARKSYEWKKTHEEAEQ